AQFDPAWCDRAKNVLTTSEYRREDTAAYHHDLVPVRLYQGMRNLFAGSQQMGGIDFSIGTTGRGHGKEAQFGLAQCLFNIFGGVEASGARGFDYLIAEAVLNDGGTTLVDDSNLFRVDVNAPNAVVPGRQ